MRIEPHGESLEICNFDNESSPSIAVNMDSGVCLVDVGSIGMAEHADCALTIKEEPVFIDFPNDFVSRIAHSSSSAT